MHTSFWSCFLISANQLLLRLPGDELEHPRPCARFSIGAWSFYVRTGVSTDPVSVGGPGASHIRAPKICIHIDIHTHMHTHFVLTFLKKQKSQWSLLRMVTLIMRPLTLRFSQHSCQL